MSIRSPVCSFLGHVDVGKTHLSDALRRTSVHAKEFGGITQQIGATYFSKEYLEKQTEKIDADINIPGLLFIDTPGHDCFTNLRVKAFEVSDVAVVVVDLLKGVEQQTVEVIENLKKYRTPYIVVANKLDKVYGWETPEESATLKLSLSVQNEKVLQEYNNYLKNIILQFAENGINVAPYYKNPDPRKYASIVPVSAKTREGVPDLIMLISKLAEKFMKKALTIHQGEHGGFVIERYKDHQHGTLTNILLIDGSLEVHDTILVIGVDGLHEVEVKEIYAPEDATEMKGKTKYSSVRSIDAAKGVMLRLSDPDVVMTGTEFKVLKKDSDRDKIYQYLQDIHKSYVEHHLQREYDEQGVVLCCPYYGPVESLWNMCQKENIPVSGIVVGQLKKMDLFRLAGTTKADKKHDPDGYFYEKRFRTVLCYQTEFDSDLVEHLKSNDITIFEDNIVYSLIEKYKKFTDQLDKEMREKYPNIVGDFKLSIIPKYIFRTKDPLILGVKVDSGCLTPSPIATTSGLVLGKIVSMEKNKKEVKKATAGEEICIKVEPLEKKVEYGKDFDHSDELVNGVNQHEAHLKKRYPDVFN